MVYCESCGEVDWCGRTSEGQHYPKVLEYNRRAYCGEPQTHRGDEVGHVLGVAAAASRRGGLVENEERGRAEAAQAFQRDQVLWPRSVFVIIFAVARSVQYVIVLAQATDHPEHTLTGDKALHWEGEEHGDSQQCPSGHSCPI